MVTVFLWTFLILFGVLFYIRYAAYKKAETIEDYCYGIPGVFLDSLVGSLALTAIVCVLCSMFVGLLAAKG